MDDEVNVGRISRRKMDGNKAADERKEKNMRKKMLINWKASSTSNDWIDKIHRNDWIAREMEEEK